MEQLLALYSHKLYVFNKEMKEGVRKGDVQDHTEHFFLNQVIQNIKELTVKAEALEVELKENARHGWQL